MLSALATILQMAILLPHNPLQFIRLCDAAEVRSPFRMPFAERSAICAGWV